MLPLRLIVLRHGWSSIWTILALAEVIGMPIESVYLHFNGVKDMSFKTLNMLAVPRNCRDENGIVTVLWTRNIRHNPRQMWIPNHCVPLIKLTSSQTITTLTTENTVPQIHSMTEFPPLCFDQSHLRSVDQPIGRFHRRFSSRQYIPPTTVVNAYFFSSIEVSSSRHKRRSRIT